MTCVSRMKTYVPCLVLAFASSASAQISPSTWYGVVNRNSGKCVDARGAATANDTAVQQYACNGTTAQQWQFQATSGGYDRVNLRSNATQVWDVANTSTADGGLVHLWAYGGGNNQQWLPTAESGGSYHFVSRNSGKCLDVPSASVADSVQLQQWACNGSAAQSFTLQAAGSGPTPTNAPGPTPTSAPGGGVLFHNTGTTSGWNSFSLEHNGSISEVTNVVYKPSTAIKVVQIYDPSYTGRYHSEVVRNDGYKPGDTRFYGFAFYLPTAWQYVGQSFNIAQFIADFTNTGCDDWMPTTMVWISGNQLHTRVKSGTVCSQHTTTFNNLAAISPGVWHRVEIQANWQSGTTGYFKLWFDGVKVLERLNIATTIADPQNRTYSFRVGMYANGWHDAGFMEGTQGTRNLWIDQVGIGTTFGAADPAAW